MLNGFNGVHNTTLLKETASQTAGPYVHIGLAPKAAGFDIFEQNFGNVLVQPATRGERIAIEGRVIDGSGTPLRDVLLEIWQADDSFRGWGRACSDFETGVWRFETVKPGAVEGRKGRMMAPHVNLWIVARG